MINRDQKTYPVSSGSRDHRLLQTRLLAEDAANALADVPTAKISGARFLITGASGLLGTHIVAGLRQFIGGPGGGPSVHAVVHSAAPDWLRSFESPGVIIHRGDLTDRRFLESLPEADMIIHAATYGQPSRFMADGTRTIMLNTMVTHELIGKLAGGGTFLFLSSSEVYAGLSATPYREDQIGTTNTDHPRACYIEGKRCGEAICNTYRRDGKDVKVIRLAFTYGPGARANDQRVLNSFIERGLHCGEIRLLDSGTATRTCCYISDAMYMLWRILLAGAQGIYNVGGTLQVSIAELAHHVGGILGVPVIVPQGHGACISGAPDDVALDLRRFDGEFGLRPFHALDYGLSRTVEWHRSL